MNVDLVTVPEAGQLVDIRGSRWVVTDVQTQSLPRSSADEEIVGLQHAVTLQSIADDRYGDEMRVIWELEPARSVVEEQGLPRRIDASRMDDPSVLAAFVDALRWGAVTSADATTYQAPFRSGATVEPYQLEPLRRALSAPRTNLLLADDVGLGKTIEAGLVVQELLLRHRARSAIIVCPAGLVLKWKDEMLEKFGLQFEIVNSETMRMFRREYGVHANPFVIFPRVIVSLSWLPSARSERLLRDVFASADDRKTANRYAFDVLIVDEAHHVAPSAPLNTGRRRGYATDSQRTVAVRELARRCEHRLFLTATPHNGYTESFTALLEMIEPQRFARGAEIDQSALEQVTVRRLKSDLAGVKDFAKREVRTLSFDPTDEECDAYDCLVALTERREKQLRSERGRNASDMATLLLKKRFFSSPWAFSLTAQAYLDTRSAGREDDLDDYDEVLGGNAPDDEEGREDQLEMQTIREAGQSLPSLTDEDRADLEYLIRWGQGYEARADSRLAELVRFLDGVTRPGGMWFNERVVVFTEYVATLTWIREVLRAHGYNDQRLAVIEGSTDSETRELIRLQFNADPSEQPVRVLLATDAAGEGIDLQRHCHRLVNFDIPFNPNRLEQRIGRVDRYGQTEVPFVWHFAPSQSSHATARDYVRDTDLLKRVANKIARVEIDLGSANEIIAPDIQRQLAFRPRQRREAPPDRSSMAVNAALSGERELSGILTQLEEQLARARERLRLRPDNLRRVVDTALALDHQRTLIPVGDEFTDADVFEVPGDLSRSWSRTTDDLMSRLDGTRRNITFDWKAVADGRTDLVLTHLGHPLVQRATRNLRAELWSAEPKINRVSAVMVEGLEESIVAAVARLVLVGASGIRLHEEVFLAGTRLARRQALGEERAERLLADALDAGRLTRVPVDVLDEMVRRWNDDAEIRARVEDAVRTRGARRNAQVVDDLTRRKRADLDRVDEIFRRFSANLRDSLDLAKDQRRQAEGMLFELNDAERRQRERDLRELRSRLDRLADEREREREAVRLRYANVTPHTFAGALVFALTPSDVRGGLR